MSSEHAAGAARAHDEASGEEQGEVAPSAVPTRGAARMLRLAGLAVGLYALAALALVYLFGIKSLGYYFYDATDINVYYGFVRTIAAGLRPYQDFPFEYPPLALPLFAFPGAVSLDLFAYGDRFAALMFGIGAATSAVTAATAARAWREGRRALASVAVFAAAVLALGPIIANRYDVSVALAVAACFLFLERRVFWAAGAALGVGFALKLVPALLLPLAVVLAARRRAIAWAAVGFAVAAAMPFLPYLGAVVGIARMFTYHAARPLQIESVLATPFLLAHLVGLGPPMRIFFGFGSHFVAEPAADLLARWSSLLGIVLLAAAYALIWRRRALLRATPTLVPLAATAVLLAFVVSGKVLSPQFLVWLLPCIALVAPERPALGAVLGAAMLLTHIEFPACYWTLVKLAPAPVAVVAARNALLVAAFVLSLVELWRLPDAATAPPGAGGDVGAGLPATAGPARDAPPG